MPKEKAITNSILRWLTKEGYWAIKLHVSAFSMAGIPDILCMVPAKPWPIPWFLEVKQPGKPLTKIQAYTIALLSEINVPVMVAHSLQEVREYRNTYITPSMKAYHDGIHC